MNNSNPVLINCLEVAKIIAQNRRYIGIEHQELFYMDKFIKPKFLIIVDKRLHVYIIGDKDKGSSYNLLNVEGFSTTRMVMSITKLKQEINATIQENKTLFLPDSLGQRIIYINPDYDKNILQDDDIYIFNRQDHKGSFLGKSKWTIDTNLFNVYEPEYTLTAWDILGEVFNEVREETDD